MVERATVLLSVGWDAGRRMIVAGNRRVCYNPGRWRHSQVVRQWSAKPPSAGSNPAVASNAKTPLFCLRITGFCYTAPVYGWIRGSKHWLFEMLREKIANLCQIYGFVGVKSLGVICASNEIIRRRITLARAIASLPDALRVVGGN